MVLRKVNFAHKRTVSVIFSLIWLTSSIPVVYGDTLYGITGDDHLISINTASPGTASLIGALDTASSSLGIFSNAGSLYAYDTNNNVLRQINPTTAATVSTINLGLAQPPGEGDIAFQNGVGYMVSTLQPDGTFGSTGTLFRFTLASNSATVVSTGIPLMDGLAFSSSGVLYGLAQGGTAVYTINPLTGAAALVGAGTGINDNCGGFGCFSFGGLTFGIGGTLYADLTNFASGTSNFYTIDPTTGVAAADGTLPFGQVSGLASSTPIVIVTSPEPSTLFLGALALIGLGLTRRR